MGHVRVLRDARTKARRSRRSTARSSSACNFLDTADVYGPVHERAARRPRDQGPRATRSCSRRSSATCATERRRAISASAASRDYVRAACERRLAASGSASTHRSLLPASRRSRTRRSRRRSARWPSSSSRGRSATSASRRRRPRRSAARTPSTRSRALQSEYSLWTRDRRGRDPRRVPRARHRPRRLQPARPRLPLRPDPLASTISTPSDFRRCQPRFQGENFQKNLDLVERVERARGREGLHRRAARARLGAGAGRRRRSDPGHDAQSRTSRRTSRRLDVELSDEELRDLEGGLPERGGCGRPVRRTCRRSTAEHTDRPLAGDQHRASESSSDGETARGPGGGGLLRRADASPGGNVVLSSKTKPEQTARKCERLIEDEFGLEIDVVVPDACRARARRRAESARQGRGRIPSATR